ncbi:MAG: YjjG family noncanonical pyrimidine nucleotidase [Marinirhabdus sp.]
MENTAIKHIFFDLDHTLWDFDKNSLLAFKRVFQKHRIGTPHIDAFMAVYKPINLGYWKLYRNEKITKAQLRLGRLKDTFAKMEVHFTDEKLNEMARDYIDELPGNNHLFEGAIEVLHYLKQKYTLHVITNGFEEVQHKKLKNSKIEHYFTTVTTSGAVGAKKPSPKVFRHALQLAKAESSQSMMIGDSLEADIEGAHGVGMQAIFFNSRNEAAPKSYCSVKRLKDLIPLL